MCGARGEAKRPQDQAQARCASASVHNSSLTGATAGALKCRAPSDGDAGLDNRRVALDHARAILSEGGPGIARWANSTVVGEEQPGGPRIARWARIVGWVKISRAEDRITHFCGVRIWPEEAGAGGGERVRDTEFAVNVE